MVVKKTAPRGFTLIEMLVVVGIIVIITSIVLSNNTQFGGSLQLQSLAYNMAISGREAQTYGTAVRRVGSSNFAASYGLHFDLSTPTQYSLFADVGTTPNGIFDPSETLTTYRIGQSYRIAQLCAAGDCTHTKLDVLYKRPEPDASIRSDSSSGAMDPVTSYTQAKVVLQSPRGDRLSVYFAISGAIYVASYEHL